MADLLSDDEVSARLKDLPGWKATVVDGTSAIAATFEFSDFADALAFVNQVGHEAEQMNHHPDIDIRWNKVTLVQSTHSAGGLTVADFELVHHIAAATGLGDAEDDDDQSNSDG
jgi:4a-hydroxytetrahydrobiopterin dehydratase